MKWVSILVITVVLTVVQFSAKTYAIATDSVLITELMTGSGSSAGSEFVELYNQSNASINVTDWKLQYQASSSDPVNGSWTTKATLNGVLKSHGFLLASSTNFNTEQSIVGDAELSSGLSASAGRIRLFDGTNILDSLSWGVDTAGLEGAPVATASAGMSYKRLVSADAMFIDTDDNALDFEISAAPFAQGGGVEEVVATPIDMCPATPEIDTTIPEGYMVDANGDCVLVTVPLPCENDVYINEVLSDPVGLEADGGEFIELFNPAQTTVNLKNCELTSSKSSQPLVAFSEVDVIVPGGYFVVNVSDKLTNAAGSVIFSTGSREDVVTYSGAKEGESMALFTSVWEVTNQPTPMAPNKHSSTSSEVTNGDTGSSSVSACAEGKYRNPATNRCKSIATASTALSPCDPGQQRNPETNRCKKVSSAAASLTPCSSGQERNPSTNRCRKVVTATASLKPCAEGQERNPATNRCRKISNFSASQQLATSDDGTNSSPIKLGTLGVASLSTMALGYAAYEYRSDIRNLYRKVRGSSTPGKPPD